MLQLFRRGSKDSFRSPQKEKVLLRQIHAFVLSLLRAGADDVGVIYYDEILEKFVFKYVVGDKMLKIVFDEASMGIELYDYSTLETKLPHLFTEEDWNTVFMILNSAKNYVMSYFEPGLSLAYGGVPVAR